MARAASSTRDARDSDPPEGEDSLASSATAAAVGRRHEVLGILAAAATVLTSLALLSYDQRGGENWIGPFGELAGGAFAALLGIGAWLVPGELGLLTIRLFRRTVRAQPLARVLTIMVT
ncbi:MAG: DNA translocase FtsK 4TM domain-containing protein, partial [Deltaproteobacteria bacterium]|nr:DNA translocase FtsK 4TM domain-containing protein [Deltaproteobacteria bacterium]